MALFLTLFIMAPVFDKVNQQALQPYLAEKMTAQDAVEKAQGPIKDFMLSQTRSSDSGCLCACPSALTSPARTRHP